MLAAAYVPRWAVIALGLPLVGTLDPRAARPWPLAAAALTLAVAALSLLHAPDPWGGALECWYLILLFGAFLLGAGIDDLGPLLTGCAAGLALSSALAVGQSFGWSPVPQDAAPAGLFWNREALAEFAAPLAVWMLATRRWAWFAVALVPLVLCHSRIAVAAAVLGAWFLPGLSRRAAAASLAALILAAAASLFLLGDDKIASAMTRLILWGATAMAVTPLGHGLGWFAATHPTDSFAHSDVLQAFAELGAPAALLLAFPALALFDRRGGHADRAAFIVLCAEALVSFPLHMPATGFLAGVLAGHLARRRDRVRGDQPLGRMADVAAV